ncbi:formylglycine-generating enzyme family protein [Kamptonema cortianum]|uniref:Formylglycine-generating enzyme family protein n=1 Tax=Geitlerinema calcuttense NRMC-F 0142 TaxID=2922238 RepID=A0ABT7M0X2_9CYAN|nr:MULTISPECIES: formylglycine-generating enzyme family protein [Cyanophyceae]MDK3156618.1 formylglycine-generating enzyme family protein [Kamptonema cortianum]MDL5050372.1 formylglycine-generating enzyme family protein [Oscillatoria amoena NRMC-F 0135]MDL5054231.1 formylglycine-generating enzyme family protein [Oscillatoria laete-virens NRMC-F 0139]MDL5057482.1 formylglycine-generating enzyme family protein [Geitlerinema calcuttense NRMC-F 0142]
MALPYPLPDDPRKWDGWKLYNSNNLYERLGLSYEENPGQQLIEECCRQLLLWWQKKLPLKSQPNNPLAQLLGKAIDEAPRLITQAKVVLLDKDQRAVHDQQLVQQSHVSALEEFQKFISFSLADKRLTPSAENGLYGMGRNLGLSDQMIAEAIEQSLLEYGAVRYDPEAAAAENAAKVIAEAEAKAASLQASAKAAAVNGEQSTGAAPAGQPDPEGFQELVEQWKEKTEWGELEDEDKEKLLKWAVNFHLPEPWAKAIMDDEEYDPDAEAKEKAAQEEKKKKMAAAASAPKSTASNYSPEQEKGMFPPFTNDLGMQMIYIPSASFKMGCVSEEAAHNEEPQFDCSLTGYYISKFPVTFAQFEQFAPEHRSKRPAWANENHPAVMVTWEQAGKFCDWLSSKDGRKYRLPTEAEWEYAAKGPQNRRYPWGESEVAGALANFADSSTNFHWSDPTVNDGFAQSSPVGSFPLGISPFGCEDMAGNVWEWCKDALGDYKSSAQTNPCPSAGAQRVVRGGSWRSKANSLRTTARLGQMPSYFANDIGFRVVCVRPVIKSA